jgi:hypothetical protein
MTTVVTMRPPVVHLDTLRTIHSIFTQRALPLHTGAVYWNQ